VEINTVNGEREATRSGSQQTQSLVAAFSGKFFFPLELYANLS